MGLVVGEHAVQALDDRVLFARAQRSGDPTHALDGVAVNVNRSEHVVRVTLAQYDEEQALLTTPALEAQPWARLGVEARRDAPSPRERYGAGWAQAPGQAWPFGPSCAVAAAGSQAVRRRPISSTSAGKSSHATPGMVRVVSEAPRARRSPRPRR